MKTLEINGTQNGADRQRIMVGDLTTVTLYNGKSVFTITFSDSDSIEVQVGLDPAYGVLAESAIVRAPYSDVIKITPEARRTNNVQNLQQIDG